MRKTTKSALCAGLIAVSVNAQATETITSGASITTASDGGGCIFLANQVTVNVSKGVSAVFDCRAADAAVGTVNRVVVGACHIGGTAKARSVACTANADGSTFSPSGCTSTASINVTGIAAYTTSTAGGAIAEHGMATTTCNDATGITTLIGTLPASY